MLVLARIGVVSIVFSLCGWARAQTVEPPLPTIAGYVTAVGSAGTLEVNARHVVIGPATTLTRVRGIVRTSIPSLSGLYFGERVDVYGKLDKKARAIQARSVEAKEATDSIVSGTGLIDLVPAAGSGVQGEVLVRADGYLLRVTPATRIRWSPPLTSTKDLKTNVWVDYHGVQQADGTVLTDTLTARANTISHSEGKLRERREFDPAQVDEGDKQGFWSKAFKGLDPSRLPAHKDPAMQARVERIGNSLVPAYQKALPDADPTKIEFRFQVIEPQKWRDAMSLPSGIILIPLPVMERLENDAQLATVLADNIAEILEKQEVRDIPAKQALTAGDLAGDIGGILVPGLGLATGLATTGAARHMLTVAERQSGRVSLWLLHDAGYDLAQAPKTWWLLGTKTGKPLDETSPPARAANLYQNLGTTWRNGF